MTMSLLEMILTIAGTVLASSGFWAYIQMRRDRGDAKTEMLIGLGHDRIMELGLKYLHRDGGGWITEDEYENLYNYLYQPYHKLGGDGSADRIMNLVDALPSHPPKEV